MTNGFAADVLICGAGAAGLTAGERRRTLETPADRADLRAYRDGFRERRLGEYDPCPRLHPALHQHRRRYRKANLSHGAVGPCSERIERATFPR